MLCLMKDVDRLGCFGGEKAWGSMWARDFWNQGKKNNKSLRVKARFPGGKGKDEQCSSVLGFSVFECTDSYKFL